MRTRISGEWLAIGAAAITVVLWASAFVGIRSAGEDLSAGPLALARLLVGSVALGLIVAWRREALPARRDLGLVVVVGVLWFGAYNLALNESERRIDAGTAAMLVNVGPILIALLAGWLLREGFPRNLLAGCAVAFTGVVVIGLATSQRGEAETGGVVLALLAALVYAGGVVSQKPLLERVSALQVTFLACFVGTVVCLPFAPALVDEAGEAGSGALVWSVYLGIFPTAIAFTTWAYALARTTAGRMGATTYLVPPLTILMSWAWLGETPVALAFAGGALCIAGVMIARHRQRVADPPMAPEPETVLVTGATDGLGRGVATELARRGWTVIAAGRDPERGEAAVAQIRADSGNERVELEIADLGELGEVRALARRVTMSHPELSVLVNNAGIGSGLPDSREREESGDDIELRFAVNHLAGFLLTSELLDTLRANAPARVVNVASGAQAPIDFDDVMLERDYDGGRAYAQSKLAQVAHARELAERVPDAELTAYSLHPSTYMPTKIVLEERGESVDSLEDGIEAVVRLATEPDPGAPSGSYFDRTRPARPHPFAEDANARARLWRLSEELTKA